MREAGAISRPLFCYDNSRAADCGDGSDLLVLFGAAHRMSSRRAFGTGTYGCDARARARVRMES
jgi:hypothetical protein